MTAFTVSVDTNFDAAAFATRAGAADTYSISAGARLIVDSDTRYCPNATTTTGNLGSPTAAGSGSQVFLDGSKVRIIPYNTGTGNVPAYPTTISKGGVSATFLGVWSAFNVAPTASGAAMPAAGYIKVKDKTGGNFSAGALTGIGASATGADTVGWMEVVGWETGLIACSVRNAAFKARGEWFTHSTLVTDGVAATTYQLPASLANTYYAGVEVENAAGSGVYDFYAAVGSLADAAATIATDNVRGLVCWISSQGVLRFGKDGAANVNGYLPVTGCAIRVPNIVTLNCTSAAPTVNAAPNATIATRFETSFSFPGTLDLDKINVAWYFNVSQAHTVTLSYAFVLDIILLSEVRAVTLTNVYIGQSAAVNLGGISLQYCMSGGTITDCVGTRSGGTAGALVLSFCSGFTIVRARAFQISARLGSVSLTGCSDFTFTNLTAQGPILMNGNYGTMLFTNALWFDAIVGTTVLASSTSMFSLGQHNENLIIDGVRFVAGSQPGAGLVLAANSSGIYIRNIGSHGSPVLFGGARQDAVPWARSGTTITVTTPTAHGFKTNDIIVSMLSSDAGDASVSIVNGLKTITVTGGTTFTFTGVAGTSSSGTMSYQSLITVWLTASISSVSGNQDILIERVYVSGMRTALVSMDNTNVRALLRNVHGDTWNTFTNGPDIFFANDSRYTGIKETVSSASGTATYGTHFSDVFVSELSPNLTSCAWARIGATSVATVTSAAHGLISLQAIHVTASSDTTAIALGGRAGQYAVTPLTVDTFNIPISASGGSSGTLTFENLSGRVMIFLSEPSASSTHLITTSGSPAYTGSGVLFTAANDQITLEMPEYIIGHTGFANVLPLFYNLAQTSWQLFNVAYQIDKNNGNGWSAWKNLWYVRSQNTIVSGEYTITNLADTSGINVGDYVTRNNANTHIGVNAKVVSIDSTTQVTVDVPHITSTSNIDLIFRQYPNEVLDPALGFKLKTRVTAISSVTIVSLNLVTLSTNASRALQYPLMPLPPYDSGPVGGSYVS